jgi:WXG100 family type VII secretion target
MPDVQMDYELMEQMANKFRAAAQQLDETQAAMEDVAGKMSDGALLGEGGDMFADALRSRLNARLKILSEKMTELSEDVMGAMVDLRDGDTEAKSRFKG